MTSFTFSRRLMLAAAFFPIQSFAQAQLGAGSASRMESVGSHMDSRSVDTRAPERTVDTRATQSRAAEYRNTDTRSMETASASYVGGQEVRSEMQYGGRQSGPVNNVGFAASPGLAGGGTYRNGGASGSAGYIYAPARHAPGNNGNARYCASEYTHHKVKDIRRRQLLKYQVMLSLGWYWADGYGPFYGYTDLPAWPYMPDATVQHDTVKKRPLHATYDGYVVYKNDTIPGIISMDSKGVTVSPQLSGAGQASAFAFSDRHLQTIVAFNDEGFPDLVIKRPSAEGKRMYRVLHEGKLCVYDNVFDFVSPYNIDFDHIYVLYERRWKRKEADEPHAPIIQKSQRGFLESAVSRTYGTRVHFERYSNQDVLDYLNKLQ